MKSLAVALIVLFSSQTFASSGQWFREYVRDLEKSHHLTRQTNVYGQVCSAEEDDYVLLTSRTGKLYAVTMGSFSNSKSTDEGPDRVALLDLSDCTTKVFKL